MLRKINGNSKKMKGVRIACLVWSIVISFTCIGLITADLVQLKEDETKSFHIFALILLCFPLLTSLVGVSKFTCKTDKLSPETPQYREMCALQGFFGPVDYFVRKDKIQRSDYNKSSKELDKIK